MIEQGTKKNLSDWIRRQLFHYSDTKNGRCTSFILSHVGSGSKSNIVTTMPLLERVGPDDIEEIVGQLNETATIDAEGLGGLQKYMLQATFENLDKPINRFIFRLNATDNEDNVDVMDSEPATQKGLMSQMMRHTEATFRISMASTGNIVGMQNRIISRQAEQIENLTQKHIELVQVLEELQTEKHQRELDSAVALRKQAAYQDITQKILLLLPTVANKLTGKNLLPEKTSSGEQMIKSLMDSLSPEQMGHMQSMLKPEQQMIIFQIYENMRKFDESKNETTEEEKKSNGAS